MTRASRATVRVPAAEPNRRTEVKTNVSETLMVAGSDGSLMVADPLTSVKIASTSHPDAVDERARSKADQSTAATPAATTAETYTRATVDSRLNLRPVTRDNSQCDNSPTKLSYSLQTIIRMRIS